MSLSSARATKYLNLFFLIFLSISLPVGADTDFGDSLISGQKLLTIEHSPYLVKQDVLVKPEGELSIEPGVEIRFMPETGITVRGVLKAQGTPTKKIRFVTAESIQSLQPNRTVRLVDGPDVNEGIIQVLEQGSWRSVCTNSRNWTQADMQVACRQLGFQGGEWHHWYPHLNDTRQILYQDPGEFLFDKTVKILLGLTSYNSVYLI